MRIIKDTNVRYYILIAIMCLMILALIIRLIDLQVINGESYRERSVRRVIRTVENQAPRGNIYDRNGNVLATNETTYVLNLYRTKQTQDDINRLLLDIANVLIKNNDEYFNNFPIDFDTMSYKITGATLDKWKKDNDIEDGLNVEDVINLFSKKYKLQEFDDKDKSILIPLRYELANGGYTSYKATAIAKGISTNTVHELEEGKSKYTGVYISKETKRVYPFENTLSHIIGYTGKISSQEYANKKEQGYNLNSIIGKSGVESSFEQYLRGTDGKKRIEMDTDGIINSVEEIEESKKGDDLYLTIDINLQKKTEEVLKDIITQIQTGQINHLTYKDARTGAAVILNVKTGEILAIASYPDYNLQDFANGISSEKYNEYIENKDKPMFNRAIQGLYPPGSTFKMITGIASMESGAITPEESIKDIGIYNKGHKPACWLWNSRRQTHGYVNARTALMVSCNYYYYEVANRMGIDTLSKYARLFGLGEKTGIEVYGEEAGTLSSREYIEEQNKKGRNLTWTIGDTLSSAIGQSYNLFTPLQMAKYISLVANKGIRTDVTILKQLKAPNGELENLDVIKNEINKNLGIENETKENISIKDTTLNAIFEGMKSVTGDRGGTVYGTFNDFPMEVAR